MVNQYERKGKPLIGITASLDKDIIKVNRENSDAILRAGGIPFIIPYMVDTLLLTEITEILDGLLLTGGGDIDPTLFGEEPLPGLGSITPERDAMETTLINVMLEKDKPVLAICRGCQILNIAAGGNMYQDLYSQRSQLLQHNQNAPRDHASHTLQILGGSKLHHIIGKTTCKVNSFHHQAVKDLAPHFVSTAVTQDGVIEAIESNNHSFVLGLQWHPECTAGKDRTSQTLFDSFVMACVNCKEDSLVK